MKELLLFQVGSKLSRSTMVVRKPYGPVSFNEWSSFPDLRTFDSDYLISVLTAEVTEKVFFCFFVGKMKAIGCYISMTISIIKHCAVNAQY